MKTFTYNLQFKNSMLTSPSSPQYIQLEGVQGVKQDLKH